MLDTIERQAMRVVSRRRLMAVLALGLLGILVYCWIELSFPVQFSESFGTDVEYRFLIIDGNSGLAIPEAAIEFRDVDEVKTKSDRDGLAVYFKSSGCAGHSSITRRCFGVLAQTTHRYSPENSWSDFRATALRYLPCIGPQYEIVGSSRDEHRKCVVFEFKILMQPERVN